MRLIRSKTIRAKLLQILMIAVVSAVMVLAAVWHFTVVPALRVGVARQQQQIARRAADQIEQFIESRTHSLIAAAQIGHVWDANREHQKEALHRLLQLEPHIEEVGLVAPNGREIVRLSRSRIYTDADLVSLAQDRNFQQAIKGKTHIGPVYHARSAEPFVTLAVPVKFIAQEINGVVLAEVTLKRLWDSISDIKVGKSGHAFVVDEKGRLIAHREYSKVLRGANVSHLREVEEFLAGLRDLDFGEESGGEIGQKVISTFAVVKGVNWAVVVEEPTETALKEVWKVNRLGISLLIIVAGAAFLVSYFYSDRIARPIRDLEQGAKLIAQGDLELKLDIHTGDEIESLADQLNRMARALNDSYQGLENKIAERTGDLSALYASMAPLASSEAADLLPKVVERLKEATHADAALIRIFDKETKSFRYPAHIGFPSSYLEATRDLDEGSAIGRAFMSGEPIIAADITGDPRLKGKRQLEAGFRSCAFLPLHVSGELRGIVHLASCEIGRFNQGKTAHLMAIAGQMGVAMENRELLEETKKRAQEQAALSAIAMAASQSLEIHETLQNALDKVLEVTGRERGTVRLKDPVSGEITLLAHRGLSQKEIEELLRRTSHRMSEEVFASGNPVVMNDGPSTGRAGVLLPQSRSVAWIPIKTGQKVVGVLGVSAGRPIPFSQREVDFLQAVGNVMGVALENARLYENERNQVKSLRFLVGASQKLIERVDIDALAQDILDTVVTSFGVRLAWIGVAEPAGRVRPLYWAGDVVDYLRRVEIRWDDSPLGHGPAGEAIRTGQPVVMDVAMDPGFAPWREPALAQGYREVAAVPLMRATKPFGHLILYSDETGFFTPERVELLQTYANIATGALENARLFREIRQRANEQAAINLIATAASQSLNLRELLQTSLDKVLEVTGRERGYIRLKDRATGDLVLAAHRGVSEKYAQTLLRDRSPGGKSDQVFDSGEPLVINDLQGEVLKSATRDEGNKSIAWIPLKAQGETVGILNVSTNQEISFEPPEVELLQAIGNVVGVAVKNAELFGETQRNLQRVRALREIDQAITSTLDLRTVLGVLMEKIDLVLPYSAATVRLFDKESGLLEPVACRNLDEKEWKTSPWKGGRGITNVVFETKAPLIIRDVQADRRVQDAEFYRKHKLVSYVGVPLILKEEVLGVLGFYTKEEHEFSSEEVEFLTTLTGQAAVAIHNAQLYQETRLREAQLRETNEMLSVLHAVAASVSQSLDLDRVLYAAIEKIASIFGFDATRIHIYNESTDEMVLRASVETNADRFSSARSFKRGEGIVGNVAASGKPMVFEDIEKDPIYERVSQLKFLPQFGYHFLAVFPIKSRLKNLGTLTFVGASSRTLSSGETQLVEAIADQIAVAIENGELYEDVRQKVAELELANRVKDEFLSVMSHELRTPLNVVMGYAGMIKDGILGDTNPEQKSALEKVISRARDLLTMITSILYATSIDANEVQVDSHPFALVDLLDELKAVNEVPIDKPLTFKWDYPMDLPSMETDREKLKHILQNLILNAVKFTDSGQVILSARIKEGGWQRGGGETLQQGNGGNRKFIEFRVVDSGIGIPDEKLPIIFEKFRQADSSETRVYGGVGLGLYIAKNFAELLGGKIELETEVGRGSAFTVTIPCAVRSPRVSDHERIDQATRMAGASFTNLAPDALRTTRDSERHDKN